MTDTPKRWKFARVKKRLPYFLVALGALGWFGGGLINLAGTHFIPKFLALPWSEPDTVAVDSQERIYVGLSFYRRVQVYDSKGRFLRGWFLPSEGKGYRLRIGEDQNLEAVTSGRLFRFTPQGEPLDSRAVNSEVWESMNSTSAIVDPSSPRSLRYEIRGKPFYPCVKRIDPNGEETTVASTPGYLWLFQGTLPSIAWVVLGMLMLGWRRVRNYQIEGSALTTA